MLNSADDALETIAAEHDGEICAATGRTALFILPPYRFRAVEAEVKSRLKSSKSSGPPTDPKVFEEQQKKLQDELQKRAEEARKRLENQPPQAAAPGTPPAR